MQRRDAEKRGRWSADAKRQALERWKASGLSAPEFAPEVGVQPGSLWRWRRELAAEERGTSEPRGRAAITFAPVQVVARSQDGGGGAQRASFEVLVGSDVRIRVFDGADMEAASRLVLALSRRTVC